MPLIHIKSLPMETPLDMPAALKTISSRFSLDAGIEERHVTVSWDYFRSGHYRVGGSGGEVFDPRHHQVLVELLVPDFNDRKMVGRMMRSVADTLTQVLKVPQRCIFIHCHFALSEMVMEGTEIIQW